MRTQVLTDPDAASWLKWLNWGTALVIIASLGAIIVGGATITLTSSSDQVRWGRQMILAGLVGALAAVLLPQWIRWCWKLTVA